MNTRDVGMRLSEKSTLHAIQIELQHGYSLSPVEAQVLAQRVEHLIDERLGTSRREGQITYQAIAAKESAGKPLKKCRKVSVHLTLVAEEDSSVFAKHGPAALRRARVHRMVYEAFMQGGALSQEDLACLLNVSTRTIKRDFSYFRDQDRPLPSRGEIQDMGRGVSHKVAVIRKYVQDMSFTRISQQLGNHGILSMVRYLRAFALVMALEDRGLKPAQMQTIVGTSENLIQEYRDLYYELNVPEYQRALERLKQHVFHVFHQKGEEEEAGEAPVPEEGTKKGAL